MEFYMEYKYWCLWLYATIIALLLYDYLRSLGFLVLLYWNEYTMLRIRLYLKKSLLDQDGDNSEVLEVSEYTKVSLQGQMKNIAFQKFY